VFPLACHLLKYCLPIINGDNTKLKIKRYATIDTETQGGGGGGGHQSLTQKSDPNFILPQNATVSSVGILVQFSAMRCTFQVVFCHIFPLWKVAGGSFLVSSKALSQHNGMYYCVVCLYHIFSTSVRNLPDILPCVPCAFSLIDYKLHFTPALIT
jgi:hypothetical protein